MWTNYSYLGRFSDAHDYKWFGLKGLNAKDSLAQYGIAARCLNVENFEYECYAPDPEEEDCSFYFVTTEGYIEEHLQNSKQLAMFMLEKSVSLSEFKLLDITEKIHLLCDFCNIIDFLELSIDESYERDRIVLDDTNNSMLSAEEVASEKYIEDSHEVQKKLVRRKNPIFVEGFVDQSFAPLHETIQTVAEEFGTEIVTKSEFVNILDDYHAFKGIPGVKRIFHIIVDNGYISEWKDDKANITKAYIAKTSKTMSLKYGLKEDWVKNSMAAILIALGYATTESASKREPQDTAKYPSELFNLYDSYDKICESYKYIETKKDSYLQDRKGVLYSSDKKALVSKGDFSQSSYSIRQGTMYIAYDAWGIPLGSQAPEIELYIPDSVVAIGPCAFENACIRNLEIPSSVKFIGSMAFFNNKISNLSLQEGLEYIGEEAFEDANLACINLPKTLKFVGYDAFPVGVEINNQSDFLSVRDGLIFNREETLLMCCTSKESVIYLSDTVEEICTRAFVFNKILKTINLGKSLRKIGDCAFEFCHNLKSILLPELLEEIGDFTFYGCLELYSIVIPPKVRKIGINIFQCCSSLSEVRCLSPYFEVVDDALYDVKEKKLISYFGIDKDYKVKKGTKIIGISAFRTIKSLKKVTLPKTVIRVEKAAFDDCTGLEEVRALNPDCEFDHCGVDDDKIVKG